MLCAEWCFPLTLTLSREGRGKNIARAIRTERLRSLPQGERERYWARIFLISPSPLAGEGGGAGKKCTNP